MWHDHEESPEEFYEYFQNSIFVRWNMEDRQIDCLMCSTASAVDLSNFSGQQTFLWASSLLLLLLMITDKRTAM